MVTEVTKALLKRAYRNFSAGLNSYRAAKYTIMYTNTPGLTIKMLALKIGQPLLLIGGVIGAYYKKKQWDDAALAFHIDVNTIDHKHMIRVFEEIDKDKTGYLSRDELQAGLAKNGMNVSDFQLDHLIEAADTNSDGLISKEEWVDQLEHQHHERPVTQVPNTEADTDAGTGADKSFLLSLPEIFSFLDKSKGAEPTSENTSKTGSEGKENNSA